MSDSNYEREEVFSKRVRAGKRTYFFDVKKSNTSRGEDFYITITESKKKFEGYVKHKIFLYKEDFNKFSLQYQFFGFVLASNTTLNGIKAHTYRSGKPF